MGSRRERYKGKMREEGKKWEGNKLESGKSVWPVPNIQRVRSVKVKRWEKVKGTKLR